MLKPLTNYVLILPDAPVEFGHSIGMVAQQTIDEHLVRPLTGTIVAVCDELYYGGYDLLHLRSIGRGQAAADITLRSIDFDVPLEVVVGDRVLYRNIVNISDDTLCYGDYILVRYDWLIAKVESSDLPDVTNYDYLIPLNGCVLIERSDSFQSSMMLRTKSAIMPGYGRVIAEGCLVKSYLMWADRYGDFDVPLVGKEIMFRHKHAVRIENDAYRTLNIDTQYPLYYLRRYAINGWKNET